MGYNDNRVVKVNEELFQPCDRVQIQMVGRLVEEQDVRVAEQGLSQKDFDLLRACEFFHIFIVKIGFNPKAV